MIKVIEAWSIIDLWWTAQPDKREYVEVEWYGRKIVFVRRDGERIWRICAASSV